MHSLRLQPQSRDARAGASNAAFQARTLGTSAGTNFSLGNHQSSYVNYLFCVKLFNITSLGVNLR